MATVRVDILSALNMLKDVRENQIPYATSRALNDTADACREALLARALSGLFKFRTNPSWIKNKTTGWFHTTWSNKNQSPMVAYVEAIKDYLFLHEYSGIRTKRGGGMLAVPLGKLHLKAIPPEMRPRFLLGGNYQSLLDIAANTRMSGLRYRRAMAGYGSAFIMHHNGHTLIARRIGPKNIEWLYVLVPSVFIQKRLQMFETVQRTAQAQFATFFLARMQQAMAGAR